MSRSIRFRVGIAMLIYLLPTIAAAKDCGTGSRRKSLEVSLNKTAMSLLNAIEQRNIAEFMSYISPRGVGFGVDQDSTYSQEIMHQIKMKKDIYCLLFSTPCIATSDPAKGFRSDIELSKWKISYAEWLRKNTPLSTEVELVDNDGSDACGGSVTVHRRVGSDDSPEELGLAFLLDHGRWVFTNTPDF